MDNVAITVIGMLAWPIIGVLVFVAVLFVLYGAVYLPLHHSIKAEVLNDRNPPSNTRNRWAAMDVGCTCRTHIPDSAVEDFAGRLANSLKRSRSLPPRAINHKINPEPGAKL